MKKSPTPGQQRGALATKTKAQAFAMSMRDTINGCLGMRPTYIARGFNEEGIPSANGGKWTARSVLNLIEQIEQLPPAPVSPEQIEAEKLKREQQRAECAEFLKGIARGRWTLYPDHWDRKKGFVQENEAFDTSPLTANEAADLEYLEAEVKRQAERDAEAARFVGPLKPDYLTLERLRLEREEKAERSATGRRAAEAKKLKKQRRKQAAEE